MWRHPSHCLSSPSSRTEPLSFFTFHLIHRSLLLASLQQHSNPIVSYLSAFATNHSVPFTSAAMAEEDDLAFLQPGFDLNSLTMPKLRNLLVTHNVPFPASAKKGQLVDLIESDILPKAKKLLRDRDRVRRTSKGITDMSSQEETNDGDDDADRELMPPPPAPKTPRSRKSKTNLGETATPSTSRRSKTPTTRKSKSKSRASDTETDGEPLRKSAKKNSRRSVPAEATPATVRIEEPVRVKREAGASPFSDDNPFQSGSSPPSGSRRVSSTSRTRTSTGRPSSSRQRDTLSPVVKREDEDSSHTSYRIPVSQLQDVPTTEEFTPEASRELQQAGGQPKQSDALIRRRRKPASKTVKSIPAVLLTSVLGVLATWYRQEKIDVGYCGVGQPSWSLSSNLNIPSWVHENLQPTCETCPPHAVCYPNMEVRCDNDYVLQPHPLSLNGLIPFPPTCEPDSEKQRRIKTMADKATDLLRDRRAAVECGGELSSGEKTIIEAKETKLEISDDALRRQVNSLRRRNMSPDEFNDLWAQALDDVKAREEVEVTHDS